MTTLVEQVRQDEESRRAALVGEYFELLTRDDASPRAVARMREVMAALGKSARDLAADGAALAELKRCEAAAAKLPAVEQRWREATLTMTATESARAERFAELTRQLDAALLDVQVRFNNAEHEYRETKRVASGLALAQHNIDVLRGVLPADDPSSLRAPHAGPGVSPEVWSHGVSHCQPPGGRCRTGRPLGSTQE